MFIKQRQKEDLERAVQERAVQERAVQERVVQETAKPSSVVQIVYQLAAYVVGIGGGLARMFKIR